MYFKKIATIILVLIVSSGFCNAQFLDSFDTGKIEGWFPMTGDGNAKLEFVQKNGYASLLIDATADKDNVYWTLIKRDITSFLDLAKFRDPSYQLRVEAKVRVHTAPRRVNFMVNTNRTTNFHIDLMEYDIADTTEWHIISLTTKKFDARPGDTVYVQFAATDFGLEKYCVDIAYYRADIVNIHEAGPDKGVLVPYHPNIPKAGTFSIHRRVDQDCVINSDFPDVNFNDLHGKDATGDARTLTINAHQWAVLRWDLTQYKDAKAAGAGLLELSTRSVYLGGNYRAAFGNDFGMEFGKVRVIEILGGDPMWSQETVTYHSLTAKKNYPQVFNAQMIYDFDVNEAPGGKNYITISQPVLQRLMNGTTKGLLLRPLGAVDASFYASENASGSRVPKLHFSTVR